MVFVCNLRSIHSLANVAVLFTPKTCQPCHYIKPINRERHARIKTRSVLWAIYGRANKVAAESISIAKNLVLSILPAFLRHTYNT